MPHAPTTAPSPGVAPADTLSAATGQTSTPRADDIVMPMETAQALPRVRRINVSDLFAALAKGVDDFAAMPTHAAFLGLLYATVGLVVARAAFGYDFVPLLFPLAAGFALIGPVAALGLYELSRRREMGLSTHWTHMFDFRLSPTRGAILGLAAVLVALFMIWIGVANALYWQAFGPKELTSLSGFLNDMVTTEAGVRLMILGNLTGLAFAVVVLAISVVSFPLLLDRRVGFATAVTTSLTAVVKNPLTLGLWGLIVAVLLFAGSLPFFMGLAVVIPVLGHASWHLYRAVVEEPDDGQRPRYVPPPRYKRYAAHFPASLVTSTRWRDDE